MTPTFYTCDRRRHWLSVWNLAVVVFSAVVVDLSTAARPPAHRLSIGHNQLSRTHHQSSAAGAVSGGIRSNTVLLPSSAGGTVISSVGGGDDSGRTTSSAYCRNNVNYHEEFVRSETGAAAGATKVEVFGAVLKSHVQALRRLPNRKVDLVFLVDSSSSVSEANFRNELKFVQRLLADFTVDRYTTRVAVVTFSSPNRVLKHVDYLTNARDENHKCSLLEEAMPKIPFMTGSTYTKGAMLEAEQVFRSARPDAKKVLFLITDGYSNGGDPKPIAESLRRDGVEIFTFGIKDGNFIELCDMASDVKHEHVYILNTFEEFEALARRALHEDLHIGNYVPLNNSKCDSLCRTTVAGGRSASLTGRSAGCCDALASCACGTHTGKYECICQAGYYGSGLVGECLPCPEGTYKNYTGPGDRTTCYPCPDINHYSPAGSITESQCVCKRGYKAIKTASGTTACAVKTCPPIVLPANAYFVQGQCNNAVHAACGIRCKSGYHLIGTSLRLCTEDGVWNGTDVRCEVKHCPRIQAPPNGNMVCTKDDFSYDTQCHFTCNPGHKLVGTRVQSCLAFAMWSGIYPKCREMKCAPLPSLVDGRITPESCTSRESPFGTVCNLACNVGYKLNGVHRRQCTETGRWTPDDESLCIDVMPPTITCPANISVDAAKDESFGHVIWAIPGAYDNSGYLPTVTVVPALVPPVSLTIGQHTITYTAEDGNKNKGRCSFVVAIRDTQPPRVDRCVSPPPFIRRAADDVITWDEPLFSDNSHQPVNVSRSPAVTEVFPIGTTQINYTAIDAFNNSMTCTIEIVVQEHACANHQVPSNGDLDCRSHLNGVECVPRCNAGYGFAFPPADKYFCDYDVGHWTPKDKWPVRDCSISTATTTVRQKSFLRFRTNSACSGPLLLNQLESKFETIMHGKVKDYCSGNMICEVDQFTTSCTEENDLTEDEIHNSINILPVESRSELQHSRRRRSYATSRGQNFIGVQRERDRYPGESTSNGTVVVEMEVTGRPGQDQRLREDAGPMQREELVSGIGSIMDRIRQDAINGDFDLLLLESGITSVGFAFDPQQATFMCPQGSVMQGDACVTCPAGTFFNVVLETCAGCPRGSYQPQEGSLTCLECPDHTSTAQNNSKSINQCRGHCLPGSFSSNRVDPCETCPIGFYQPDYAQTSCVPCQPGMTTWRRGSWKPDDCGVLCPEGHVSKTGLEPCFPCPRGYFQPERGRSSCFVCPAGRKTRQVGATDITDCAGLSESAASLQGHGIVDWRQDLDTGVPTTQQLVINECFAEPCVNGATCHSVGVGFTCACLSGWTGLKCEVEVDECLSQPCLNNATCTDQFNGFNCTCPEGYTGAVCDVNIDECATMEPCLNNATCVDLLNAYRCECTVGFNGTQCEQNIDDCALDPCKNGGKCIDGVAEYSCHCLPGFQGVNCEVDVDECLSVKCQNNGTCVDSINSFHCQCKVGYAGDLCQLDIDECQSTPCLNNATCLNLEGRYSCQCPPSYAGIHCETKLNSSFDLVFRTSSITNYAALDGAIRGSLSALTVAMWLRTDDRDNQGTPLSYATSTQFNGLALTDCSGFVLYIDGVESVTDVAVNDGRWHHVTVTWSGPATGAWTIYVDGLPRANGTIGGSGGGIEGGGILVVGQEQDARGGGFSSNEAFIGRIHAVNLWDYELSPAAVASLASECDDVTGNLVAWPDFVAGINGHVELVERDICQGCGLPPNISHSQYTLSGVMVNDTVSYTCDVGYKIDGPSQLHCQLTTYWVPANQSLSETAATSGDGTPVRQQPRCNKVVCGYPGDIANGRLLTSSYTYGTTLRFYCNTGHRLIESDQPATCAANGTWSGSKPVCELITCPTINLTSTEPLSVDGNRTSGYRPGDSAKFNCRRGFRLVGRQNIRCQDKGTWDTSFPVCDEILCRSPPVIDNAQLVNSSSGEVVTDSTEVRTSVGNNLTYRCVSGYKMAAGSSVRCGDDGRWANDRPRCIQVTCRQPDSVGNGTSTKLSHPILPGSHVEFQCNVGFVVSGQFKITCTDNGDWNSPSPRCLPVACPPPGEILNGVVVGNEFTYGGKVKYSCTDGYVLDASGLIDGSARVCMETGNWNPSTEPVCRPRPCQIPEDIANGYIVGRTATPPEPVFGDRVEYKCDEGYRLEGQSIRICLENGTLSDQAPDCVKIRCTAPVPIEHGAPLVVNEQTSSYDPGSSIRYRCDHGYMIVGGRDTRICRSDGTWAGPVPHCVDASCPLPSVNVDHHLSVDVQLPKGDQDSFDVFIRTSYPIGSIVEYRCNAGYRLFDGKSSIQQTCVDGIWNGPHPVCIRVDEDPSSMVACPAPNTTIHGTIDRSDVRFQVGSTVIFRCDPGYVLNERGVETELSRTCLLSGAWSGEFPACQPIDCGEPPSVIPNGRAVATSNYTFQSTVDFVCDEGFHIAGDLPSSVTCKSDGLWTDPLPVCTMVECPPPLQPSNGAVSVDGGGNDFRYGRRIVYSCQPGFQLVGAEFRTCLGNRTWSGADTDEPRCVEVECPRPNDPDHGLVEIEQPRGLFFGGVAIFTCHSGYSLVGGGHVHRRHCGLDGNWSPRGEEPKCVKVVCGKPPKIDYGIPVDNEVYAGDEPRYSCDQGYQLIQPDPRFVCNAATGNYTGGQPHCQRIECPKPETVNDADIDAPGNALGDVVRYRCRAGFELVGSAELVCTETGAWSPLAPSCIPITCPAPEHVPNAIIYQQGYDFRSTITYSCIDGRVLESGSTERVCQADRTWSGEAPVCSLPRCPTPKIDHGFVASSSGDGAIEPHVRDINRGFVAGVTIELDCEEGFRLAFSDNDTRRLTEQETTFTCLVNSSWSGRMPSCHRVRCPEPHVPNSVITAPKGFVFGFRVMFTCIEGYELVGSNLVACGATGNWTSPLPKCTLVFCDAPPPVDNSVSDISRPPSFNDSTTYVLGTTIIYSCQTGFRFVGPSASIICRSNRKWSAVFPSCQRVTCSPPLIEGDLAPEVIDPRDVYAYNDVITFHCGSEFDDAETRYQLVGVDRMWCNGTGFWNGSVPECRPLVCPPVQLQYGVVTSSIDPKSSSSSILHGLFVGTELTFKCNDGYRLAGNVTLTCTKSLTWSASLSSCIPVVCSPPVIVHGRTVKVGATGNVDSSQLSDDDGDDTIEYPVGTKVLIGCDLGYQLPPMAASASVCMESTSWSPDLPDCVPVTCPTLSIEGGRITVNGNVTVSLDDQQQTVYRYLDTVVVECLSGHTLTGQQSVQCESTGLWSGRVPSCERVRCPEPAVQNGTVRPIDVPFGVSASFMFSFGVIISITCDDGHLLVGTAHNVCQDDGTWIDPFPVCEPVRCPPLVVPDAVVQVPDVPEFGSSATVRCNVGYELFGDSILRCQATGRWSGITPLCLKVMCKLPAVANARIVRVNSTGQIQLQQQHVTTSSAVATSVATPQHGYSYGEEIIIECLEGYELHNASSVRLLTCGPDKIWKPSLPSCRRRQCVDPLLNNITNLLYKITQPAGHNVTAAVRRPFVFGTRIDFECNLGFRLNGSSTSMYCDVNGNWNSPATSSSINRQDNAIVRQSSSNVRNFSRPSCIEVFCPTPAVEDGIVHKSTVLDVFSFGDQVKISCKSGFELVGDAELVCQPNAEWTPDLPSCVRRKCLSRPPLVESGYIVGQIPVPPDAARFGDVINYRCDAGYEIVGSENITCLADGRWSDRPTCLPVRCPPPETIRHGTYISSGFAYGSSVRYACNTGYELIGTADHECMANATWSGKAPACSRVQCSRPPYVPYAVLMGSEVNHNSTNSTYLFGDKLTVKCNTGYRLVGSASIDCLSTGSWSRVTASCKVIVCGDPPHVRLAQPISVTGNGRDFNSTMGYVCQAGYELDRPEARAVCQADGSWSDVDASCVRVRCSYPTIPDHVILNVDQKEARTAEELAKLRPDGFRYRDRVYVSCVSGHETGPGSGGLLTMACGTDGRWNGTATAVQCSPVHCSQPPKHGHLAFANVGGSVTISRLSYPLGHTLEVRCDPGYKLSTGNDRIVTVTCQPDRSWNLTASVACQKVVCPTPGSIEHGTINGSSYDYGSRIEHVCSPGYVLVGDRYRKCGENGTWDSITSAVVAGASSSAYCAVANCTLPDVPANGHVIATDGLSFGSVVRFRCRPGYQIAGSSALMCLADARWNSSVPTCQIKSCPKPEIVDNADIVVNGSTTFDSVVTYRCYKGYELRNSSGSSGTLRCNENGTWSGTVPTCRRISCSKPEAIDNGYTRGSDLEYGATVLYACDAGYELQGNSVRHCMADRTWNGSLPICRRKQCPPPAIPLHGKLIDFDNKVVNTPGSQVEFGCEKGYQLNGSHLLVCTELETWSDALPTCVPITCDTLPPSVTNAEVMSDTDIQSSVLLSASPPFNVGHVVRYVCRRGYRLLGPETVQCEVDGSWSAPTVRGGQSTSCQRVVCPEPPKVKHAMPVATGRLASDLVYYVCDEGYDLTGNNLLECSLEARWTGTLPICEPITCGVVPVIPHATTIVHRTTLGSRATYECNRGFRLRGGAGSAVVECKANRTWTYAVRPACVPVDCGSPPQPSTPGTELTYDLTTFTSVATYFCLEGFRFADEEPGPTGNEIRDVTVMVRCGESGRWNSTEAPVCEKVTCPDPGPLLNGRHQLSGTGPDMRPTFGRDVKFTCNAGYQLNGSSIRTCQPDGSWSGQAPSCRLLHCDDPVSPANGNWSVTGRHFGSTVTFWCMPGYTMVGTAMAVCGPNGKWSEDTPECVAESGGSKPACDPLPVFDNAQEVEGVFLVGDTVHVSCKPGFQSNGSAMLEVTCQDDLTWTEPRERCERIWCPPPRSDPMNVVIHGSGRYQFGDRAFYTCRQGTPATEPILTCTETGEWDHLPHCIASCKFPCQNGGTCVGGNRCKCPPGFGGRFCDAAICILPCLNGGHCSGPYKCDCPHGFSGPRCENPVCAKPCLNGGRCVLANRCICPHGFVPPFCERHRFNGNLLLQDEAAGRLQKTSWKLPSDDNEEKDQLLSR